MEKLENCVLKRSCFFPANVANNLGMECIEVKDRWLTSSFPVLAPFPSSKQIGQLSMTQPGTQRQIMRSTTLHRGISFVSFSPDSFISLLSNEESGKGEVSLAAIKIHHSSNNH